MHHDSIKSSRKSIESNLCDYSEAYTLVTGNIKVTKTIAAAVDNPIQRNQSLTTVTQLALKNCPPFKIIDQISIRLLLVKQIL